MSLGECTWLFLAEVGLIDFAHLRNSLKLPDNLNLGLFSPSFSLGFSILFFCSFLYFLSSLEPEELLGLYPKLFLENRDLSTYKVVVASLVRSFCFRLLGGFAEYFLVRVFNTPFDFEVS